MPQREQITSMLAAYIHENEDENGYAVGGLAGTADSFIEMGREWARMLSDFGIHSLRMDHLSLRTGECTGWDAKRVNSLLEVAAGIIVRRASSVHGYFIDRQESAPAARHSPESTLAFQNRRIAAAMKTVVACGIWSRQSSSTARIPIVFDQAATSQLDIDTLSGAALADGIIERYGIGAITCAPASDFPALQAAALVAEECRHEFRAISGREKPFRPFHGRSGRGKPSFKRLSLAELLHV
jgi:hypothetical protein